MYKEINKCRICDSSDFVEVLSLGEQYLTGVFPKRKDIEITKVQLLDRSGLPVTELASGDALHVEIKYMAHDVINSPIFLVYISDENQRVCCTTNTQSSGLTLPRLQGQGQITLHLERLDLINGCYFVNVEIFKRNWAYSYDAHWHLHRIRIRPTNIKKGVVLPPHNWEINDEWIKQ